MKFEIERRHKISYEEFAREYLYPNKPVIICGALEKWKALKRWTPELFKADFGDKQFSISDTEYGEEGHGRKTRADFTMASFIDRVLESSTERPAPYFRNESLYDLFPSLKEDVEPLPEYLFPNWLGERYLVKQVGELLNKSAAIEIYIGGKGASFPVLHYDGAGTHAFLMQIYGRKRFIVYPPAQEKYLYPSPVRANMSLINSVEEPDLKKYPLFANAEPTITVLEPGELLFVPSHWWHTAKMLTVSITISANVLNDSNWHELVSFVGKGRRSSLLRSIAQTYLRAAGAKRSWRDRAWRRRAQVKPA